MPVYFDQMMRPVYLPFSPRRIISLVPSQTELLFDLGLDEQIAGITKFCTHPENRVKSKQKVGGTKQLNISLIAELNPDLIIGNKEENERQQIEELMQHFPVWMSDISNLDDAVDMITKIGEITNKEIEAQKMAAQITQQFNNLVIRQSNKRVAYFIWRKPYMVVGKTTFIDDMLKRCGLINAFDTERYPEITGDELMAVKPDIIFLSSEPYPFKDKHIREFGPLLPHAKVKLVDGEMFSWYGSRLLQAPEYFKQVINSTD
jgi:ABC-type Fe3+-hydroxamate transport system substrate-binding protein